MERPKYKVILSKEVVKFLRSLNQKTPKNEIDKAEGIRIQYFNTKSD